MKKRTRRISLSLLHIWIFLNLVLISHAAGDRGEILFDFEPPFDVQSIATNNAKAELVEQGGNTLLRITMGHTEPTPDVTLKAPKGKWDLTNRRAVAFDVKNIGNNTVNVACRVDNPGANGRENCITGNVRLKPEESRTLKVFLCKTPWRFTKPLKLVGMFGTPGVSDKIDPSDVVQLLIFPFRPKSEVSIEVDNICAEGELITLDAETFFPFVDKFGQFIHADWPGKIRDEEDLKNRAKTEEEDLKNHPGPRGWNRYGGWKNGPQLKASGFFRAEKYKGKWWLVDPDGRLFWSQGINCVPCCSGQGTPLTDRKHYFKNLPDADSPFGRYYGKTSEEIIGYYKDKGIIEVFYFGESNKLRKYGKDYEALCMELPHRRLRSWGQNTIGAWSNGRIAALRRTPYVCTIDYYTNHSIEASEATWVKFPDPFSPGFRTDLRERLERESAGLRSYSWRLGTDVHNDELGGFAGDPWCIGIFVDNELKWGGDEISLALACLASLPEQPGKVVFLEDLKAKYREIQNLNDVWGTDHASWKDLLWTTETPDEKKAGPDLRDFYTRIAEQYFRVCRDEVKRVAPNHLYLGCRFDRSNHRAVLAAAKYCDILSYNGYFYDVSDYRPPSGIDMPAIISEFMFGAPDRGMFSSGLVTAENQEDRAAKYKSYVQGALRNPFYVGAHWFEYANEAVTGRTDNWNGQAGFVDICDTPYDEIVRAAREVGDILYEYRLKN